MVLPRVICKGDNAMIVVSYETISIAIMFIGLVVALVELLIHLDEWHQRRLKK